MFSAASLLVLLQLVLGLTQATKTPPKSLQIGVRNKVDPCPVALSKPGDLLSMHYTGYLFNLTPEQAFDSSVTRNQAFEFTLGQGQVIKGWDQGLLGMCPGDKRKLIIPPDMGYGSRGAGDKIPPDSTLVFEVELLENKSAPKTPSSENTKGEL